MHCNQTYTRMDTKSDKTSLVNMWAPFCAMFEKHCFANISQKGVHIDK